MAPRKKKEDSKGIAIYEEQLAQFASAYQTAETEALEGSSRISLRGGCFNYQGDVLQGDSINVVILASAFENAWYKNESFDSENPTSPHCYAIKLTTDQNTKKVDMKPSAACLEPQEDACSKCHWNKFGTSRKGSGKGKDCKQTRRLALMLEDDLDNPALAEVAYLNVPIMSTSNWISYVKSLAVIYKRPPFGVITQIKIVRDPEVQFYLEFSMVEVIKSANILKSILENKETFESEILYEFPAPEATEAESAKKKPAAARKGASRESPTKKPAAKKPATRRVRKRA